MMHFASFITLDDDVDLVVSFAVVDTEDGSYLDCLNVIRTPKYEKFLEPEERCPMVTFPSGDAEELRRPLRSVVYSREDAVILVRCDHITHTLDLSKVDKEEIEEMARLLRKMSEGCDVALTGL
jgi:hypothetical protein